MSLQVTFHYISSTITIIAEKKMENKNADGKVEYGD